MTTYDPVNLFFGGMEKLGPGSNADTLHVLRMLPERRFNLVVDAGCGAGRQTLALAAELDTVIHAIDSHQPFLDTLVQRAREAQIGHLVEAHCMDMSAIPQTFLDIDLLWAEGSAYNIGFRNALTSWAPALAGHGLLVVSELSWLKDDAPAEAKAFFQSAYPDMQSTEDNMAIATDAGYRILATHTIPPHAWVDGYYDVLELRAKALLDHPDAVVRGFAAEMMQEIDVFNRSEGSYGYIFYVLERGLSSEGITPESGH